MKKKFFVDTCSLIALGYSGHHNIVFNELEIYISQGVILELEEISSFSDEDSSIARMILDNIGGIKIERSDRLDHAEDELILLCKEKDGILVSDDLKALRSLSSNIRYLNSVHLIYLLMRQGKVSRLEARMAFNKMRKSRDWNLNQIAIVALELFDMKDDG